MGSIQEVLSESHCDPLPEPFPSLHERLIDGAKSRQDSLALACLHQPADFLLPYSHSANTADYLRWTFADLERASHHCAQALAADGLRPGNRIVAYIANGAQYQVLFRAALELNCLFCPMNPKSVTNAAEVKNCFDMLEPDMVVAQDEFTARKLDDCTQDYTHACKIALDGAESENLGSWRSLETFMDKSNDSTILENLSIERKAEDVILVLMTSGTTSLPKGCPHTNRSFTACAMGYAVGGCYDATRSLCAHLPMSHIFGMISVYGFHLSGLPIVHASSFFEPATTLRAIREERTTDFSGVPAIVSALLAHPDCAKTDTSCLQFACLGATTVTPAIVKSAMEDLKVTKVTEGWGMTEGAPASMTLYTDCPSQPPETLSSGYAIAGVSLRVCDPESGKAVPRGQPGELRMTGSMVIRDYWTADGRDTSDEFVEDEHGRWLKTGDQAIMRDDGAIEIVGRYKHLIIRGGENISPKSIESVLLGKFGFEADVVGIPDEVSGEAPAAVIKASSAEAIPHSEIQATILKDLGQGYGLQETVPLHALRLEDFPKTATGKVQKDVLRDGIIRHLEETNGSNGKLVNGEGSGDTTEQVTQVWRKVLGVDDFKEEDDINDWADSLVIAGFPAALRRETGYEMTVQEILTYNTASSQAEVLSKRTKDTQQNTVLLELPARDGPPGLVDMIHAQGSEARFQKTRQLCEDLLSSMKLNWDDVKDIIPMYSFQQHFLERRRLQSNNHRHAYVAPGTGVEECRTAVEAALSEHDMLRTLAIHFEHDNPLHVVMRPSKEWFQHCITTIEEPVETAAELKRLLWNDPDYDYAAFPGPMFRVVIGYVKEQDCASLVYMGQHSVFDGISLPFFLEDLDALLSGKEASKLPKRVPFKAWVDSEYSLRQSLAARVSVDWHVKRLRGCHTKGDCLFPIQRAPEWFKGSSLGWTKSSTGKPGPDRASIVPDSDGVTGLSRTCDLTDMQRLKQNHGIDASTVLKTALALLNMKRTGTHSAFFAQYQAARTWPYLQEWQASRLPSAMEVDGPTVQAVVVAVELAKEESCLAHMRRMQSEQGLITQHAHAPFGDIVTRLNEDGSGDGDFMVDAWRRQIFNWLPGSGQSGLKTLQKVQQVSRTDCGILWNCIQLNQTQVQIMPSWDDAQLTPSEIEHMLTDVIDFARALATAGSWSTESSKITALA